MYPCWPASWRTPLKKQRPQPRKSAASVVKAQVKVGGRGKAGGVKVAKTPDEAFEHATNILGMDIKGHTVNKVMIAQGADIAEEFYFSVLLDRANRNYLAMCSVEGGMEIEELAVERPEALAKIAVDPAVGIDQAKADEIVAAAGFAAELRDKVAEVIVKLWDVFKREDATLVEVNPLVAPAPATSSPWTARSPSTRTPSSATRNHAELEDKAAADPLEAKAKAQDLNYVKLDGAVGIIGNGAGLVMSTLDVVAYAGENHGNVKPANFLDIGGGASAEVMAAGLDVILNDRAGQERVRERLRRHHRLRRRCQGHRRRAGRARVRRQQAAGRPPRRQQRRRRPPHPARGQPPAGHPGRHHGRGRRQGRRTRQRS